MNNNENIEKLLTEINKNTKYCKKIFIFLILPTLITLTILVIGLTSWLISTYS